MTESRKLSKDVLKKFRTVKVLTITELMEWLNCSMRTVHRRLRSWGAISSYNRNGRFYTIEEVADFDANGIWCWEGVCFSRYGNLFETTCGVLDASTAGLTGAELGQVLGVNAQSYLSHFMAQDRLARERMDGRYVYFSALAERRAEQQQERRSRVRVRATPGKLSCVLAVEVLVAMIRDPEVLPEQLAEQLQAQGIRIEAADIEALLAHHGLSKKKASPQS